MASSDRSRSCRVLGPLALVLVGACVPATEGTGKGTGKETEGCYQGAFCDPDLACVYGFCVAEDGEESDEIGDEQAESSSSSDSGTSEDSSSDDSSSEDSSSDDSSSDDSSSDDSSSDDSSSEDSTEDTTTTETTDESTTGDPPNCGWNPGQEWYECGFMGEDPGGEPIECPMFLVPGANCPAGFDGTGCCDANGDNWYCTMGGQIAYDPC